MCAHVVIKKIGVQTPWKTNNDRTRRWRSYCQYLKNILGMSYKCMYIYMICRRTHYAVAVCNKTRLKEQPEYGQCQLVGQYKRLQSVRRGPVVVACEVLSLYAWISKRSIQLRYEPLHKYLCSGMSWHCTLRYKFMNVGQKPGRPNVQAKCNIHCIVRKNAMPQTLYVDNFQTTYQYSMAHCPCCIWFAHWFEFHARSAFKAKVTCMYVCES